MTWISQSFKTISASSRIAEYSLAGRSTWNIQQYCYKQAKSSRVKEQWRSYNAKTEHWIVNRKTWKINLPITGMPQGPGGNLEKVCCHTAFPVRNTQIRRQMTKSCPTDKKSSIKMLMVTIKPPISKRNIKVVTRACSPCCKLFVRRWCALKAKCSQERMNGV